METDPIKEELTANELYLKSQIYLIRYMMKVGIIKNPREYAERFAEIFHDLASGKLGITNQLQKELHDKLTK